MMTEITKIILSDKELELVSDARWILTKQSIIQKAVQLFGNLVPSIKSDILQPKLGLPAEVISTVPKIYKGENYKQLPYVMLDYPRCFNGNDIFAVRTMFWWANFFSITLHVSGKYVKELKVNLQKKSKLLSDVFYIGINENPWEHHFEENNYLPFSELNETQVQDLFNSEKHLKIALKYELDQWNMMEDHLKEGYKKLHALMF